MDLTALGDSWTFTWIVLPALIFTARVLDVSMGTLRVIYVSRGMRLLAPVLGFFEVLVWLAAIGQVMQNLTNVAAYLAYAGGFATGTFVGMAIEQRLSLGVVLVRIITGRSPDALVASLKEHDFGVTVDDARGARGPVRIVMSVVRRKELERVVALIERFDPNAFYAVEDVRRVREGVFPLPTTRSQHRPLRALREIRKGK